MKSKKIIINVVLAALITLALAPALTAFAADPVLGRCVDGAASSLTILGGTLLLDGTPTPGQTYDLMATASNSNGKNIDGTAATFKGFDLTGLTYDSANWSLAVVDNGLAGADHRNVLQVTSLAAVPEPASLGLLAVGGLALLRQRKA